MFTSAVHARDWGRSGAPDHVVQPSVPAVSWGRQKKDELQTQNCNSEKLKTI